MKGGQRHVGIETYGIGGAWHAPQRAPGATTTQDPQQPVRTGPVMPVPHEHLLHLILGIAQSTPFIRAL